MFITKPTGVDFPLTEIDVFLKSGDADFDFLLKSDSLHKELELKGNIENLSELVIGNTGKPIKTNVNVTSPKLIWNQFIRLFIPKSTKPAKKQNLDTLKSTVKGIFDTFGPTLHAKIDTFVFSEKFSVMDLTTGIHMSDSNKLILEETAFNFYNGNASLKGQFDFNDPGPLPFTSEVRTQDLDVEKLLRSLDYLNLPSLRSIEKLSGRITMDLQLAGIIAENGLVHEATKGQLDVLLNDVELLGMAPLDTLARKIRMEKRFHDLLFAPIQNHFTIDGLHIDIPMMEIQSNAINLFMKGTLSYGDKTNLWIAIPLDNLKKADRSVVPPKRGYAATKSKVYIEVTSDEVGNNKFKFRLSSKKFYKQRGIKPQYREDKRKSKKIRKELKKQNRK